MRELARHVRSVYLVLMLASASVLAGLFYVPPDWRAFRADVNALWEMKDFASAFDQFLQFVVEEFGYDPVLEFPAENGGILRSRTGFLYGDTGKTNSEDLVRKAISGINPSEDSLLDIAELWDDISGEWYVLDTSRRPNLWVLPEGAGTNFEYPRNLGKAFLGTRDAAQFLLENQLSLARLRRCGTGLLSFQDQKYLSHFAELMIEKDCGDADASLMQDASWMHGYALVVNNLMLRDQVGGDLLSDALDGNLDTQERLDSLQRSTIAFSQYIQYLAGMGASIDNGYAVVELPVREVSSSLYERIEALAGSASDGRIGQQFSSAFPSIQNRFAAGRVKFMSLEELRQYSEELEPGGREGLTIPVLNIQVKTSQFALWASVFVTALFTYLAALASQFKSSSTVIEPAEGRALEYDWLGFVGGVGIRAVFGASLLVPVSVTAVSVLEQISASPSYVVLGISLLIWSTACAVIVWKASALVGRSKLESVQIQRRDRHQHGTHIANS